MCHTFWVRMLTFVIDFEIFRPHSFHHNPSPFASLIRLWVGWTKSKCTRFTKKTNFRNSRLIFGRSRLERSKALHQSSGRRYFAPCPLPLPSIWKFISNVKNPSNSVTNALLTILNLCNLWITREITREFMREILDEIHTSGVRPFIVVTSVSRKPYIVFSPNRNSRFSVKSAYY